MYCAYGVLSVLTNPNSWGVVITKAPAIRPIIATTTPMPTKIAIHICLSPYLLHCHYIISAYLKNN